MDESSLEPERSGELQDENQSEFLKEITDVKFQNVSIKGYEKKSSTGFPKEEYYAFRIVSMYGTF